MKGSNIEYILDNASGKYIRVREKDGSLTPDISSYVLKKYQERVATIYSLYDDAEKRIGMLVQGDDVSPENTASITPVFQLFERQIKKLLTMKSIVDCTIPDDLSSYSLESLLGFMPKQFMEKHIKIKGHLRKIREKNKEMYH